tara:strand:- start:3395 stop:4555 length:1161 start_codon:yes stop_codon:yes gene_type:complete
MGITIDYSSGFFEAIPTGETVGSVSGNATLDLTSGNVFNHTPTANTTFVLSNPPASGTAQGFTLALTGANVSIAGDIANASYDNKSFNVSSQEQYQLGVFVGKNGTRAYVVGNGSTAVYQYSLSTAYDISSASYSNVSFSVSSQASVPVGLFFKPDGTVFYIGNHSTETILQYGLTTAWDVSTASYSNKSFSTASQAGDYQTKPAFSADGSVMIVSKYSNNVVYQYTLSTAWDVSTASYANKSFSLASQLTELMCAVLSADGSKMWAIGTGNDTVFEYNLSTNNDISTASYNSVSFSVSSQDTGPKDMVFANDDKKLYIVGATNSSIFQYTTLGSALATIAYPSSVEFAGGTAPDAPANGETDILSFYTTDGGTTYFGFKAGDAMS